jgi:hypothetical protein
MKAKRFGSYSFVCRCFSFAVLAKAAERPFSPLKKSPLQSVSSWSPRDVLRDENWSAIAQGAGTILAATLPVTERYYKQFPRS